MGKKLEKGLKKKDIILGFCLCCSLAGGVLCSAGSEILTVRKCAILTNFQE